MDNIAILGMGVVGGGVYEIIKKNGESFNRRINIAHVFDKRPFTGHELESRVTSDYNKILDDPSVSVVVETMGGADFAFECSKKAIMRGKSVVTSNKAVVEKYGLELESIALENGVSYLYEASVGGGIPIIHPLNNCLRANRIERITGILNGTTNFILYNMEHNGMSFDDALKLAQAKGYAEADPTADVGGFDTARKICILASIAFGKYYKMENCAFIKGITEITVDMINEAKKLGFSIKLLGVAHKLPCGVSVFVSPCLVRSDSLIAATSSVFNAVSVVGDMLGEAVFYGKGAGSLATASAVVSDILECINSRPLPIVKKKPDNVVIEPELKYIDLCGTKTVVIDN